MNVTMPRTAVLVLAAVAVATSACAGQSGEATAPASVSVAVAPSGEGVEVIQVSTELTSANSDLHTVGPDNSRVFGWNLLTGQSTFRGEPVEVRLQGSVEYNKGSGPFEGFLRIVAADESQLAFRVDGQATAGSPTQLPGRMYFIGASGRFADMVASGTFAGTREAEVGAPVVTTLNLVVDTDGVAPDAG
jgi:hypothetical protein